MKIKRQRKIIDLISNYEVETQEELAKMLVNSGYDVTQATISRDIRDLNLTKITTENGKQKYAVPNAATKVMNSKYMRVLNDGILSIETSANIMVIKTVAGMAMAVGAAIDAINIKEIIGCIAGDDTIMCVIDEAENSNKVKEYLDDFII